MSDSFTAGFVVAIIGAIVVTVIVSSLHCHSLGFITACY